uniref:Uncharacterized protein n=1 Tax=Triticum urartu TaxID=4572 RepID=A0A8R7QGJ0_TRIUA
RVSRHCPPRGRETPRQGVGVGAGASYHADGARRRRHHEVLALPPRQLPVELRRLRFAVPPRLLPVELHRLGRRSGRGQVAELPVQVVHWTGRLAGRATEDGGEGRGERVERVGVVLLGLGLRGRRRRGRGNGRGGLCCRFPGRTELGLRRGAGLGGRDVVGVGAGAGREVGDGVGSLEAHGRVVVHGGSLLGGVEGAEPQPLLQARVADLRGVLAPRPLPHATEPPTVAAVAGLGHPPPPQQSPSPRDGRRRRRLRGGLHADVDDLPHAPPAAPDLFVPRGLGLGGVGVHEEDADALGQGSEGPSAAGPAGGEGVGRTHPHLHQRY